MGKSKSKSKTKIAYCLLNIVHGQVLPTATANCLLLRGHRNPSPFQFSHFHCNYQAGKGGSAFRFPSSGYLGSKFKETHFVIRTSYFVLLHNATANCLLLTNYCQYISFGRACFLIARIIADSRPPASDFCSSRIYASLLLFNS